MPEERAAEHAAAGSTGVDGVVTLEQMALLFNNAADVPVNLLNACLSAVVLWPLYPPGFVLSWLGVFCVVSGARAVLRRRFMLATGDARAVLPWARLFTLNAFVAGCLWGATATGIALKPDSVYTIFIVFVLGGTMAGGVVCTATYKPAMWAFILPTILPAIAALAIEGGRIEIVMAIMLALFTGAIVLTGLALNDSIVETFRLRIAQRGLMARQRASEAAMAEAQTIAHVGAWSFDLRTHRSEWSLETFRVLGVDPATFPPTFEGFLARVHPDDRALVEEDIGQLIAGRSTPGIDHRLVMTDGSIKFVQQIGRIVLDSDGQPIGLRGTVQDVTHRKGVEAELRFANVLLESEMEASPDGVIVIGPDRHVIFANQRMYEVWKVPRGALRGLSVDDALTKAAPLVADISKFIATAHRMLDNPAESGDAEYVLADGRIVSRHTETLSGESGEYLGRVWYFRDITAARNAAAKLELANSQLRTQMEASPDATLVVDMNERIISYNQRFGDMWSVSPTLLASGNDEAVLACVAAALREPASFAASVRHLHAHPDEHFHDELETLDGRTIDRLHFPLLGEDGQRLGHALYFRDITERKRNEASILRLARSDALTGLANRTVFVETLEHAIEATKRSAATFAVLYLDLDHFKDVNDTLGHPLGDELLRAVAERLRANTRATDVVARFGGDEFAIIVPDIKDPADPAVLAEKLIDALEQPFFLRGNDIQCGASIGIALYGPHSADAETLLAHADVALYGAKGQGRGSFRFFSEAMDVEVQERVKLGAELRVALEAGQLFLAYQPELSVDDERIKGVEALVRWRHPRRGELDARVFVPIAERTGVISKLGYWVLKEACLQGRRWLDAGIAPIRIGVHVSPLQFKSALTLEADVAGALALSGFPAEHLELTVSESMLMDASSEQRELLERLRDTGVTIAIDDFGSAYSSLDYLRRFPTDRIKIARTFVAMLRTTPGDAAVVEATIGIARELGIAVIAEGVETEAQREMLRRWGCAELQGLRLPAPLGVGDATTLLRGSAGEAFDLGPEIERRARRGAQHREPVDHVTPELST